jgi:hypothetical protein
MTFGMCDVNAHPTETRWSTGFFSALPPSCTYGWRCPRTDSDGDLVVPEITGMANGTHMLWQS